ncbi:hypothetical protein ACFY7C_12485 [Streptomyces sp. NPDC012769]|uniref:hypothetical protein n=1 Tax=Streptomyces sp. NPDC012769 TaxID=3364848 RepID=UPI0036AA8B0B
MHHFLSASPSIKFGEGKFEIGLTNSVTGEVVTVFGSERALFDRDKEDLSYDDVEALGRYLAECLSYWEGKGGSGNSR